MGIGVFLKSFAPLSLYLSGLICAVMAMGGNVRLALFLVTFLLPLRNVIEKIQNLPLGTKFIDILLIGSLIGWVQQTAAEKREFCDKSSVNTIAIVLMIYMTLSLIMGDFYLYGGINFNLHDTRVQDWKNFCLFPVIFFLIFNNIRKKEDIARIFAIICVTMFISAYYTVNQIHSHSSLIAREKISGTFQFLGPNEVAAFFNGYTIVLMSVFYALKNRKFKWFLFILILANIYCITFLYSRGAYAGLILGMLILFAIKDRKLLIPLVLILLFWQAVLPQNVIDRIKQTKSETGELDVSSQRRIDIWDQALNLFKSNPVTGIGFGVFRRLGLDLGDTHNIYIKILTEQGLIGIIIFLLTLFCFIKEGFQLYQKGDDEFSKALGLGFFCSIFVIMVNNFFGDRWSYLEPNAYLWIFAGLVARLNVIAQNPQVTQQAAQPKNVTISNQSEEFQKTKKKVRYYDVQ